MSTFVVKNTPIYSYYESLMLVSKSHQPLFLLYLIVNFETGKYIDFIFWATRLMSTLVERNLVKTSGQVLTGTKSQYLKNFKKK